MRKPVVAAVRHPATVSLSDWSCADGNSHVPDDDGNVWVLQVLDGWWGGVDVRASAVERPLSDGDYDGVLTFGSRSVAVEGKLIASSVDGLLRGMDRFAAILTGSERRCAMIVVERDGTLSRQSIVRLGGPSVIKRSGRTLADFSLSLYAADPLRYGVVDIVTTVDDDTDVVSSGDAASYAVVTFAGPLTNPVLSWSADRLALTLTLAVGEQAVVDCSQRSALLGAQSIRQYVTPDSRWVKISGGTTSLAFTKDSGAGTCTVTWREAWS